MFNVGPLFPANYNATEDIIINQGGTDSGKTHCLMQIAYTIATTHKAPESDPIISILNESIPNSKKGAYRIAKSIFMTTPWLADKIANWNEGERVIYFKSGWIMEFLGATDEQNAKQGKRQYLFVNEANGISWPIFWQMAKRTRVRTFIDYNPSAPFWAHEKLIGTTKEGNDLNASIKLLISDHRHNPFLSERDHEKTENINDKELWWVYARGKTGNLQGIVYPNWKQIADKDFPWHEDGKFGGLDFGYTNDPTAGVMLLRIANNIYAHELCYKEGMPAQQIHSVFKAVGMDHRTPIYCEHDGDMIRQLRMKPFNLLAIAARKGAGSINAGITKVKEYNIFYTASSKNIDFERKKYMFIKDNDTGRVTNVPTDLDNHLMDAIRYGVYSHFYRKS